MHLDDAACPALDRTCVIHDHRLAPHFKIKTVSDKLVEDGTLIHPVSQNAGLYALRKVVDPLLTTDAYPAPYLKKPKAGGRKRSKVTLQSIKQRELEDNDSLMAGSILN